MANRAIQAKLEKAKRQARGVFLPCQRFGDTDGVFKSIEGTKSFYITAPRALDVGPCDGAVVIQAEGGLVLTKEGRDNVRATPSIGKRQAKLDTSCGGDFNAHRVKHDPMLAWNDYAAAREEVWPIVRR